MGTFTDLIEVADARAENGAEQIDMGMVINELLTFQNGNLEAAHGRIMDADITQIPRLPDRMLVQSSATMVASANRHQHLALTILRPTRKSLNRKSFNSIW